jgi:hypothetical protein
LAGVAFIVALAITLPIGLSYYDSETRKAYLRVAVQELPPHASIGEMAEFMRRHTARYALDDRYHHEYTGIVTQTRLDRFLFDRKVQLVLKVNEGKTLQSAEVRVFYTAL